MLCSRRQVVLWIAVSVAVSSFGCSTGKKLRANAKQIDSRIERIRDRALRCTPKQLAVAEAQVAFGKYELQRGNASEARSHLNRAKKQSKIAAKRSDYKACRPKESDIEIDSKQGDRDGDGISDDSDECPNVPEDIDDFRDKDGCPDLDNDGDGKRDEDETCPDEPEDFDGYQDTDGCDDPDNDGDDIADILDKCRDDAEDYDGDVDDDGCPEKRERVTVKEERIELDEKVHFETDKAKILPDSYPLLNDIAKVLKANESIHIRIEGHTDSRGSEQYNLKLSKMRAQSVHDYLVDKGIAPDRLEAKGYGESRPIADNATKSGRTKNRRVEIHITERK